MVTGIIVIIDKRVWISRGLQLVLCTRSLHADGNIRYLAKM